MKVLYPFTKWKYYFYSFWIYIDFTAKYKILFLSLIDSAYMFLIQLFQMSQIGQVIFTLKDILMSTDMKLKLVLA